jgi:hypothetical protein
VKKAEMKYKTSKLQKNNGRVHVINCPTSEGMARGFLYWFCFLSICSFPAVTVKELADFKIG